MSSPRAPHASGSGARPGTEKVPGTDAGDLFQVPPSSALERIRTFDLLLRRQPLYPLSYEGVPRWCLRREPQRA